MSEGERIVLYPFEHFDLVRRRWVRGRYVARIEEIAKSHGAFRITGAPEVREGMGGAALTAGHIARGPRDPETLPSGYADDRGLARSDSEAG